MLIESPLSLSEAEIQLLIGLIELSQPTETPNNNHYLFYPQTISDAQLYFKGFLVDWSSAYISLQDRRLISNFGKAYSLTKDGVEIARKVRDERPPIYYWYQEFYGRAPFSPAYASFCERLYGRYLCQANFSDMYQLEHMVDVACINKFQRVLDLGCGIGMITEYLSDLTGATFIGIDYAPRAIELAQKRTQIKRDRLEFQIANFDSINYPTASFDTIVSIDTLYMPTDLYKTLARLVSMLKPGGQLVTFYSHILSDPQTDRFTLSPDKNPLGLALTGLGMLFETWDFTEQTNQHLQCKHQIGLEMEAIFAYEGNQSLYNYIMAESESNQEKYDSLNVHHSRYLYRVIRT